MKTKIYTKIKGLTKWLIILCATICLAMSDLSYIKYFYILCSGLIIFHLFEVKRQNNRLLQKMEEFIMFPSKIVREGVQYEYQGAMEVKTLCNGWLNISNFDLTFIQEIKNRQYQGFYKQIKETNQQ